MTKNPKPMHPGLVLNEVYMAEMGLNQSQLASKCKCSPQFAIDLEKVLGTSAEMRVRMQADYDLWVARKKAA